MALPTELECRGDGVGLAGDSLSEESSTVGLTYTGSMFRTVDEDLCDIESSLGVLIDNCRRADKEGEGAMVFGSIGKFDSIERSEGATISRKKVGQTYDLSIRRYTVS